MGGVHRSSTPGASPRYWPRASARRARDSNRSNASGMILFGFARIRFRETEQRGEGITRRGRSPDPVVCGLPHEARCWFGRVRAPAPDHRSRRHGDHCGILAVQSRVRDDAPPFPPARETGPPRRIGRDSVVSLISEPSTGRWRDARRSKVATNARPRAASRKAIRRPASPSGAGATTTAASISSDVRCRRGRAGAGPSQSTSGSDASARSARLPDVYRTDPARHTRGRTHRNVTSA
jgi:hypothetical protein